MFLHDYILICFRYFESKPSQAYPLVLQSDKITALKIRFIINGVNLNALKYQCFKLIHDKCKFFHANTYLCIKVKQQEKKIFCFAIKKNHILFNQRKSTTYTNMQNITSF